MGKIAKVIQQGQINQRRPKNLEQSRGIEREGHESGWRHCETNNMNNSGSACACISSHFCNMPNVGRSCSGENITQCEAGLLGSIVYLPLKLLELVTHEIFSGSFVSFLPPYTDPVIQTVIHIPYQDAAKSLKKAYKCH